MKFVVYFAINHIKVKNMWQIYVCCIHSSSPIGSPRPFPILNYQACNEKGRRGQIHVAPNETVEEGADLICVDVIDWDKHSLSLFTNEFTSEIN